MTTTTLAPWTLRDAWTITLRTQQRRRRQPWAVAVDLAFPVVMVLMFGYLLDGAIRVPDGDYLDFLMPGLFALTMVFGLEATMTAVQQDLRAGITDRFRTLPMSSASGLLGRSVADMIDSTVSLGVMLLTGLVVGWRPGAETGTWVGEHAVLLAVVWPVLLTLVLGTLAVRRWRTLDR